MANKDKVVTKEEKKKEEEQLRIQSEAISKLYKNKQPIDNSKNTRH